MRTNHFGLEFELLGHGYCSGFHAIQGTFGNQFFVNLREFDLTRTDG
ncbi:hypothetical protein AWB81_08627 [Caballeronia arationis]|nr:hypothetical protein AWB81_08627 [Caballeronia arationis]